MWFWLCFGVGMIYGVGFTFFICMIFWARTQMPEGGRMRWVKALFAAVIWPISLTHMYFAVSEKKAQIEAAIRAADATRAGR